ncbi:hypothetical protein B0H13DRAFT_2381066 [Mycena leptocephala]|nr:hypothetical protein B0H13DRAFT_2381066 [Mycena leptocephala]
MERVPETASSSSASAFAGKHTFDVFAGTFGRPHAQALSSTRTRKDTHREQEGRGEREQSDMHRGQPGDTKVWETASLTRARTRARTRPRWIWARATVALAPRVACAQCVCAVVHFARDFMRVQCLFQRCSRRLCFSLFHSPPTPTPPRKPTPPLSPRLSFVLFPSPLQHLIARHEEQAYPQTHAALSSYSALRWIGASPPLFCARCRERDGDVRLLGGSSSYEWR